MRLQNTFLKGILNRKVIVRCGSGRFAELLLNCLLYSSLLVIGLNHHHFAWILLDSVLLHILSYGRHLLRWWRDLHASLWSVTQDVLVAYRMRIGLKQGVRNALIESVQLFVDDDTWSQLVFKQAVVHRVVPEVSRKLVSMCWKWIVHGTSQVLYRLSTVFKFLFHHQPSTSARSLWHICGIVPLHPFDDHFVLRLVWLFLNGNYLLSEHSLPYLLVNCFLRYVFLDCIKRILIRHVDASVSLCLRGLHTNLNSWLLILTMRLVVTSSWIGMDIGASWSCNGYPFGMLVSHREGQVFVLLNIDSLIHGFSLVQVRGCSWWPHIDLRTSRLIKVISKRQIPCWRNISHVVIMIRFRFIN